MRVYAKLYSRKGAERIPSPTQSLDPVEIVEDLIYRVLGGIISKDAARSPRYSDYGLEGRFPIWTMDYSDPISPGEVLDDLVRLNPGFYWTVGPSDVTEGLHPLVFDNWGVTPKYAIDESNVKWENRGDDSLYNRVTVRYKDAKGRPAAVIKTASYDQYPDLEDLVLPTGALRVRDADPIDLGDGISSRENAERVGGIVMDALARRPVGGTVVVTKPMLDTITGRVVNPNRIRPGVTASVGDIEEPLRVTKVVVDGETGHATVSLSSPRLTIEDLLKRATKKRRR